MNRNSEFIKNTIILFIGKFATQFMSLLLLPLFTHYLITEEYGTIDLLQTYITLFVPVLTLRMDSAVFRFLIDNRHDENGKKKVITNTIFVLISSISFTVILALIFILLFKFKYIEYVIINLFVLMISNVLLQLLRGTGKNKEYSIASIITGSLVLIINIILIVFLKFGAESILISSSIANVVCMIYIIIVTKMFKMFDYKLVDKKLIKTMLKYSLPMIPNALSWWIVGVSDRSIISFALSSAYNGIYAVSCKFSNILNSVFSIFNMSWQETASLHINDSDSEKFFSNIINKVLLLFGSISLLIVSILPFVYDLIIGKGYSDSYLYIPILLYANLGNVLANLIGGIYLALKKTKEIATTTIVSGLINIVIDLILINFIGLYAAVISTFLSYVYLCVYRFFDCKKYIIIQLKFKKMLFFTFIFIFSSFTYMFKNLILCSFNLLIVLIYIYIENKDTLKYLIKKFFKNKKLAR